MRYTACIHDKWRRSVLLVAALAVVTGEVRRARGEVDAAHSEPIRAALRDALASADFQGELPLNANSGTPPARSGRQQPSGLSLAPLGGLLEVLVWMALAAMAIALIVLAVRALFDWGRTRDSSPEAIEKAQPGVRVLGRRQPRRPDFDAQIDSLTTAGQYAEAAHVTLLAAIDHLAHTQSLTCRSSDTSREVVQAFDADDHRRGALNTLVAVVERSLFGGQSVTRERLDDCRRQLQVLRHGAPA